MKKRIAVFILSLLLLYTAIGCGGWEEDADPLGELSAYYQAENEEPPLTAITTFTLPYYAEKTLDPITCDDGIQHTVSALLYEGLFSLDEQFSPQPLLADSCLYDSETFTYTIHLRTGAVFSDGSPITAQDVVKTLERARSSARYASRLSAVEKITAKGSDQVVIRLKEDNRLFPARLDIPITKSGTENNAVPTGSGPYVYVVGEAGPYLTASPLWWKSDAPLSQIDLQSYKSADAAAYAFTAREIQLLACDLTGSDDMPSTIVGDYADTDTTVLQYLCYNVNSGVFADRSLRVAVSATLDREELISAYLMGHGCATQFPMHPHSALYPAELETEHNGNSFYSALAALGHASGKGSLSARLLVNEENSFKLAIANRIAELLSVGDLQVSVVSLPWEQYMEAINTQEYELFLGETKMTADWDVTSLLGQTGTLNFSFYINPEMEELLQDYLSVEEEGRALAAEKLCRLIQDEAPITPLFFKEHTVLTTSDLISGLHPTETNPFYDLSSWKIHLTK